MSQRKLAGERYTGSYICQIESGKTRPSLKALEYIAVKLNKPISYFYTEEDAVPSEKKNKRIDLIINQGEEALLKFDYAKALKNFQEAFKAGKDMISTYMEAVIRRGLGQAKMGLKQYEKAREELDHALELFLRLRDFREVAYTKFYIAHLYHLQGKFEGTKQYLDETEKLIKEKKIEDPAIYAKIWNAKGIRYAETGSIEESIIAYTKAIEFWNKASNLNKIGESYINLIVSLKDAGEIDKAVKYSQKALGIFEALNGTENKARTLLNLGIIYYEKNSFDEALDCLTQAFSLFEELGNNASKAYVLTELAKVESAKNNLDKALEYGNNTLALAEEYCDEIEKGRVLAILGEIATKKKDWKGAKKFYKDSIEILEKYDVTVDLTKALQKFSQLLLDSGETGEASTYLQEALHKLDRLDLTR
jgi:tetratricopeptide (TPR) repeat protein